MNDVLTEARRRARATTPRRASVGGENIFLQPRTPAPRDWEKYFQAADASRVEASRAVRPLVLTERKVGLGVSPIRPARALGGRGEGKRGRAIGASRWRRHVDRFGRTPRARPGIVRARRTPRTRPRRCISGVRGGVAARRRHGGRRGGRAVEPPPPGRGLHRAGQRPAPAREHELVGGVAGGRVPR